MVAAQREGFSLVTGTGDLAQAENELMFTIAIWAANFYRGVIGFFCSRPGRGDLNHDGD